MDVTTDFSGPQWTPQSLIESRERERQAENKRLTLDIITIDLARNVDKTCYIGLTGTPERIDVRGINIEPKKDYNAVVARTKALLASNPDARLVIDCTGAGLPIFDWMKNEGLDPFGISIHGGTNINPLQTGLSVPKRDLVYWLVELLNRGMLHINSEAAELKRLQSELASFQQRASGNGNITYSAPNGQHDDTVLSLAIGCYAYRYFISRMVKRKATQRDALTGRIVQ